MRILLVEDEPSLRDSIQDNLKFEGFQVDCAERGDKGLELALSEDFQLILLDLMLPGLDGFAFCRALKKEKPSLPILILSARTQSIDVVRGLELGADDYIKKPFEMAELLARVKVRMRLAKQNEALSLESYQFGDISVDFKKMEISKGGRSLPVTTREFRILQHFIERRGEVVTRDELLNEVWGYNSFPTTRTVDNYILRIRKMIENEPSKPEWILSIRGSGYRFTG